MSAHNNVQVVAVRDLLNELDNKVIINEVESCIKNGYRQFVIDLSQLNFMNSVGLNFLLSMMNKSKRSGGTLAVANASEQVVNLLKMTKLDGFFVIQPTIEAALDSFVEN